jgi:hypothetical protein
VTRVRVTEGTRIYTGSGHAPFQAGRALNLPAGHAAALAATGHVEHPDAAAQRQAAKAAAAAAQAPAEQDAATADVPEKPPEPAPPTVIGPAEAAPAEGQPVKA